MSNKKPAAILVFVICLCFILNTGLAQSVHATNIHFRTIDERIEIFYDLPINEDSLQVKIVFRKKSAPKFKYYPKVISGDVGIGIFSGTNKKITWYFKREPTYLFTGSGFYFKITAVKIHERKNGSTTDKKIQ